MELKRARHYAELVRGMDKGMRTYAAIVTLDDRITELENRLSQLLSDAVPDKKWDKVFKGSAIDYLRHRAAHFIKNYGDPVRGARMNQLANELEEREKLFTELEAQRDELVEACKELIIESANNITNEGRDGIEANKDDIDLIEKVTGKIWQEI